MNRIGVDLGGTKIEAIAIDARGVVVVRERVATPAGDYDATLRAIRDLVVGIEARTGAPATVGVGTPGSSSQATGRLQNANSVVLNGRPLGADLDALLAREVRLANDANCFALSEAIDGAGAGHRVVFGVILGTGVGGGLVIDGVPWAGRHGIAGEWGHNGLPRVEPIDLPLRPCYCGRLGCIEQYLCGPALAADHAAGAVDATAVVAAARDGDAAALGAMDRYGRRLAKSLASVVNLLDPDVIVLGGGVSNIDALYETLPSRLGEFVFCDVVTTPMVKNRHGDSSGVRGAAWLWPAAA